VRHLQFTILSFLYGECQRSTIRVELKLGQLPAIKKLSR
jgi:hypothetical protein